MSYSLLGLYGFHVKADFMGEIETTRECRRGESAFGLQLASNPEAVEQCYIQFLLPVCWNI